MSEFRVCNTRFKIVSKYKDWAIYEIFFPASFDREKEVGSFTKDMFKMMVKQVGYTEEDMNDK